MESDAQRIENLLRQHLAMDFAWIARSVTGRSRRSLYRDLAALGYLTSFTHAGSYYTLMDIPQFDKNGLWFFKGAGFSRFGTLKNTVARLVDVSEAGYTHAELKTLLRIRVHNTLLALVLENRIVREVIEKLYVYVSPRSTQAGEQIARRRETGSAVQRDLPAIEVPVVTVIELLLEVIRAGKVLIEASEAARRLCARGIGATVKEAETVYARYGLKALKKTVQ